MWAERTRDIGESYHALSLWHRLQLDELLGALLPEERESVAWIDYMARRHPGLVPAGLGGECARLLAGPEGLVFYAMNGAAWRFVPKTELSIAGVYLE